MSKKLLMVPQDPFSPSPAPHLGFLILASVIKDDGYDIKIFGGSYIKDIRSKLIKSFRWADIICFSSKSPIAEKVIEATKIARDTNPEAPIITGGWWASTSPEDVLRHTPSDIVVTGCGEDRFRKILNLVSQGILNDERTKYNELSKIPGIGFKMNGDVVLTDPSSPIDPNDFPDPDWNLVDLNEFSDYKEHKFVRLHTSRGCPFNCNFCAVKHMLGKRYLQYKPERIINQIETLLKRYPDIISIKFHDETFTANKKYIKELCKKIREKGFHNILGFTCMTRIDTINEEIINELKKTNFRSVGFGIESGSDRILMELRKGFKVRDIRKGIEICIDRTIIPETEFLILLYLILVTPKTEMIDVLKTIRLCVWAMFKAVQANYKLNRKVYDIMILCNPQLSIFKNSDLWDKYKKYYIFPNKNLPLEVQNPLLTHKNPFLSAYLRLIQQSPFEADYFLVMVVMLRDYIRMHPEEFNTPKHKKIINDILNLCSNVLKYDKFDTFSSQYAAKITNSLGN
jgi:radical SAM superfamily enzyme YgiQ (UPF0313 family)